MVHGKGAFESVGADSGSRRLQAGVENQTVDRLGSKSLDEGTDTGEAVEIKWQERCPSGEFGRRRIRTPRANHQVVSSVRHPRRGEKTDTRSRTGHHDPPSVSSFYSAVKCVSPTYEPALCSPLLTRTRCCSSAVQQVPRPACAELGGRSVPLCQQRCESIGVDRQAHPI